MVRRPPPLLELPRHLGALLPGVAAVHPVPGAAALSTFQKLPGGGGGSWLGSPSATVAAPPLRQLPPSGKVQKPEETSGGTEKVMPSPASVLISACRAAAAAVSPAQPHLLASHSSGLLRARRAKQLPSRAAPSPPRRRLLSCALSPAGTPLPGGGSPLLGASVAAPLARCRVESTRGGEARVSGKGQRFLFLAGGQVGWQTCAAVRLKGAALGVPCAVAPGAQPAPSVSATGRGRGGRPLGAELPGEHLKGGGRAGFPGCVPEQRQLQPKVPASFVGGRSLSSALVPPPCHGLVSLTNAEAT